MFFLDIELSSNLLIHYFIISPIWMMILFFLVLEWLYGCGTFPHREKWTFKNNLMNNNFGGLNVSKNIQICVNS